MAVNDNTDPKPCTHFLAGPTFLKTLDINRVRGSVNEDQRNFRVQKGRAQGQGDKLSKAFEQLKIPVVDPQIPDKELLDLSRQNLGKQYDSQHGGFGSSPKFPTPTKISKLLLYWAHERNKGGSDKDALEMVMTTLTQMARGGIYDHVGGGFCRYSTDSKWMIPHFEKMLYDNGQLLSARALYLDQTSCSKMPVTQTPVTEDLRHPKEAFLVIDADSGGRRRFLCMEA